MCSILPEAKIKDAYKVPRALSLYSPTIKNSQILDKFESDIALRFKKPIYFTECVQIVASSSPTTQSDFPMKAPWNASDSFLEINEMPFYWRLSDTLKITVKFQLACLLELHKTTSMTILNLNQPRVSGLKLTMLTNKMRILAS